MKLWQDDEEYELIENDGGCCSLEAVEDARSVAQKVRHTVLCIKLQRSI